MATTLDRARTREYLENFDLCSLFLDELGWDHGGTDTEAKVAERTFLLQAVAHKRGMVVYQYIAEEEGSFPDHPTRQKIEKVVAKTVREHLVVYATHDRSSLYWQWVKREPGRPDRTRHHIYHRDQPGEALIQKLEQLVFTLDEEENLTIVDVSGRVRAAFDVEKVTKRFYDRFKKEHDIFLGFITGLKNLADSEWYASLMLNRMMFIYFIQKQGFLDGDLDYLQNRLQRIQAAYGDDRFQSFYRLFLLRLFHEGLGKPEAVRSPELTDLLGRVPYLNGGLFDVHELEQNNPEIQIPDEAFRKIFDFFDTYQWHLDDRPLRNDNEINPDVLGYIFEKYINQKQMGAYYTKEDITGYITRNTVIPFLFDRAKKECSIAFKPDGGIWRLLSENPDRYFYEAVRHGITYDLQKKEDLAEKRELPPEIDAGLKDVSRRENWNTAASPDYALPTETWREHVARRQRYEEIHAKLKADEVTSINDLITYNLDIEKFAQDVIAGSEGPELIRAFWKAITQVSILDPTCGSGAFLFAALNILEPIYTACLEAMQGFLDDLERSQRKHRPEKLSDFRMVLEQVAAHASEHYFILKSIIVNNLYGVDIMEEAAEICKLRLFLKLVAQLESYEQIEPLPDIDFNIRAGNTLVGFTTLKEIKDAFVATPDGQQRILYPEDRVKLDRIEEDAKIANQKFQMFRHMQTQEGMNSTDFSEAKLELRKSLDKLREELDRHLATEYGVKTDDQKGYRQWRLRHQPFHWFVEFYEIMHKGRFDVVIGNPPYVSLKKIDYSIPYYQTKSCGDLFALCCERSAYLNNSYGNLSMIVPLNAYSTEAMSTLRNFLLNSYSENHLSYFSASDQPASLFSGVRNRLMIFINLRSKRKILSTTRFLKWFSDERDFLFSSILKSYPIRENLPTLPTNSKLSSEIEESILRKVLEKPTLGRWRRKGGSQNSAIYYHNAPVHWGKIFDFVPFFKVGSSEPEISSHIKPLFYDTRDQSRIVLCFLNSSLFYWWNWHFSNCRDLSISNIDRARIDLSSFDQISIEKFRKFAVSLMKDYKNHSKPYKRISKGILTQFDTFYPALSKAIIDEIDHSLAKHYGFTDEELDFIINYDFKYRMGLGLTLRQTDA